MSNEDPQEGDSAAEAMRLIDEDPQALTKVDAFGRTPLHCAVDYRSDASEIIMVLLHRSAINVIGTQATNGFTPLHYACERGVFLHAIRLMIRLYPKALKILNNTREPPLHVACRSPQSSLETIRFPIDEIPALCLLADSY
jgi:ankyrin repeat protein